MAIQCLIGEEQTFVTYNMFHGKPMQLSHHRANVAKLAPFSHNPGCIILTSLQSVDVDMFCSI